MLTFRFACVGDAAGILDIYSHYVISTTVTFETEIPSIEAFKGRIEGIASEYPFIVCEDSGTVVAFAYASRHRERAAYLYDADMSVYIAEKYHGRRIGTALYSAVTDILKAQGYYNAYAAIALPNEKSVGFHIAMGFTEIGLHKETGYKHGVWIDLLWMEKTFAPHKSNPHPVKRLSELDESLLNAALLNARKVAGI